MPAPLGNNNRNKGRLWRDAIMSALEKKSRVDQKNALEELALKLVQMAEAQDIQALRELGDRIDGKPQQAIVGGGEGDAPIQIAAKVEYVNPASG